MNISKEFKVGLLVIAAAIIFYMGFNYLKGSSVFTGQNTYYVEYDNVQGLVTSSPVQYKGLNIGIVDDLSIDSKNQNKIIATLIIDDYVKLNKKSVAQIYSTGLISDKAINLILNNESYARGVIPQNMYATSGDTLRGDLELDITETVALEVRPVREKADKMLGSIDSILNVIKGVFDEKTQVNITSSIGSIESTLRNFEKTTVKLNSLIDTERQRLSNIFENVESITRSLAITNSEINFLLKENQNRVSSIMNNADLVVQNVEGMTNTLSKVEIENTAAKLQVTIDEATKTINQLNGLMTKVNSGKGSLGLLLNDDVLYNNLERTSADLDKLIVEITENPKKFVQFNLIERKDKSEKQKK